MLVGIDDDAGGKDSIIIKIFGSDKVFVILMG